MHIRLLYCLQALSIGMPDCILACLGEQPVLPSGILPSLFLTLWGERVGTVSIKHLLSSKGPLFPFQLSLRFHDTVYLADLQLKFSSGIQEIHIKGRGKKGKDALSLSLCLSKFTLRLISWHDSHETTGGTLPCPLSFLEPLGMCGPGQPEGGLWALGGKFPQQRARV